MLFSSIHKKLDTIIQQNKLISQMINDYSQLILAKEKTIMANLDSLTVALAAETDAVAAAVSLIVSLAEQIKAVSDNQAAVDALADQFAAQAKALADAVVANTPAAPVAPVVEEVPVV